MKEDTLRNVMVGDVVSTNMEEDIKIDDVVIDNVDVSNDSVI